MASIIPSQERHVDPFASYNSNTVNKLTQMITRGKNGITTKTDLDVIQDSTNPTTVVDVIPGFIFKDDVLIQLTETTQVDFEVAGSYAAGPPFNEAGWYAILFEYTYVKSRPAPTSKIKILKPSQISSPLIGNSLIFLKAVYVAWSGSFFYIDTSVDFLDYYPGHPTIKREYTDLYFGVETTLPLFNPNTDQGRVVYETSADAFWFGYSNRWGKISAGVEVTLNTDTTGVAIGTLCYTNSSGNAEPAIATDENTGAEMVVLQVGLAVNNTGRSTMGGFVGNVPVESGIIVNVGDLLYLSNTEAGTVTNVRTAPARQVVGRAITGGNSAIPLNILFFPRDVLSIAISGAIHPSDWAGPDGAGLYFEEIGISALDIDSTHPTVLVNVWDDADDKKISPADVQIIGNGIALRIYSPLNTVSWNYIISTGGGSVGTTGGGGGTNDHTLLFNLDYLSSGHTGFSPSPHGNANHSSVFITGSGVTFAHLNANGDVGVGSNQVSVGNHDHTGFYAPNSHGNSNHTSTFITNAGVTFENLNVNGDVGTGANQVSIGTHTHTGLPHSGLWDDQPTKHRLINDAGTSLTELWSASKINSLAGVSTLGNTLFSDIPIPFLPKFTRNIFTGWTSIFNPTRPPIFKSKAPENPGTLRFYIAVTAPAGGVNISFRGVVGVTDYSVAGYNSIGYTTGVTVTGNSIVGAGAYQFHWLDCGTISVAAMVPGTTYFYHIEINSQYNHSFTYFGCLWTWE